MLETKKQPIFITYTMDKGEPVVWGVHAQEADATDKLNAFAATLGAGKMKLTTGFIEFSFEREKVGSSKSS